MMSLVRLLGSRRSAAAASPGSYREVATNREITYVEEKGHDLQPAGASAQSHAGAGAVRRARAHRKSVIAVRSRHTCHAAPNPIGRVTLTPDAARGKPSRGFQHPHTILETSRGTLRFYLGDCLDVLRRAPAASVSAVVTSPPYNLGVRYRSYDDSLPRERATWIGRASGSLPGGRVLEPDGSLFLNVGAKPTDPWTAMDVAQAARRICSFKTPSTGSNRSPSTGRPRARGRSRPGSRGRPLQANQQRALRQRLPRVHFSLHAGGTDAARSPRHWRASTRTRRISRAGRPAAQSALPRQHVVHSLRHDPEPRQRPAAPGDVSAPRTRVLFQAPRPVARRARDGPFSRTWEHGCRRGELGLDFIGIEMDEHYLAEAIARDAPRSAALGL